MLEKSREKAFMCVKMDHVVFSDFIYLNKD